MTRTLAIYLSGAWKELLPRRGRHSGEQLAQAVEQRVRQVLEESSAVVAGKGLVPVVQGARFHPEYYGLDYQRMEPWEMWDRVDVMLDIPAGSEMSDDAVIQLLREGLPSSTHIRLIDSERRD